MAVPVGPHPSSLMGQQDFLPLRQEAPQEVLQADRVFDDAPYVELCHGLIGQPLHFALPFPFLYQAAAEVEAALLARDWLRGEALHGSEQCSIIFHHGKNLLIKWTT